MTEVDKQPFAAMMASLDVLFGKESSKVKAQLYWEGMQDIPIEVVRSGYEKVRQTLDRYPSVAKWRQCCELAARDVDKAKADKAFQERLKHVAQLQATFDDTTGEIHEHIYNCDLCEDTGWQACEKGGFPELRVQQIIGRKEPYYMKRCACWATRAHTNRPSYATIREERSWND